MDVPSVIRQRLDELGLEQRDLAAAARVTESYVSQLLTRKKSPPAPDRTDIYATMGEFLKLQPGQLARLAEMQRREELKKKIADPPLPFFKEVRELVLRKCPPAKRKQLQEIFVKDPFGDLERLVTQKLLDVVKGVAREELESETWLRIVARMSDRSYEQMRVTVLEFLDTDVFNLSDENCVSFLNPLIESWDVDLATFGIEIVLNRRLAPGQAKKFEFVEQIAGHPGKEPGLVEFLDRRKGSKANLSKE
ncbi:MAG: helix-turn-helix transcriptional regulator [Acidobacteria bacterium]|nr:helix-turn-helix transcriptional regulator [Acidobacteriota bacterium]